MEIYSQRVELYLRLRFLSHLESVDEMQLIIYKIYSCHCVSISLVSFKLWNWDDHHYKYEVFLNTHFVTIKVKNIQQGSYYLSRHDIEILFEPCFIFLFKKIKKKLIWSSNHVLQ